MLIPRWEAKQGAGRYHRTTLCWLDSRPMDIDTAVIAILQGMTRIPAALKSWRAPVIDLLNDNRFFNCNPVDAAKWRLIIKALYDSDKTAFSELLGLFWLCFGANFINRNFCRQNIQRPFCQHLCEQRIWNVIKVIEPAKIVLRYTCRRQEPISNTVANNSRKACRHISQCHFSSRSKRSFHLYTGFTLSAVASQLDKFLACDIYRNGEFFNGFKLSALKQDFFSIGFLNRRWCLCQPTVQKTYSWSYLRVNAWIYCLSCKQKNSRCNVQHPSNKRLQLIVF